jgi:3-hydroxyisobutyrate dehydrogenase-like beta-hydroxyacid dehydrogenase
MSNGAGMRLAIGWIGLGRIGAPMAARVLDAGFALTLWARRQEAAAPLVERGATWVADAAALLPCDIVCTIVSGPDDVQTLQAELMPLARPGTLFIDMSTAAPRNALAAAERAEALGLRVLDAPVTGGVAGAHRGTLTSFVGGTAEALALARPLLSSFSQRLVACGPSGSGYRTKLLNQTLMCGSLLGLADGARLARAWGLAAADLQAALEGGTGSSFLLPNYLPRMIGGGGPVTFTLGLLLKDLKLARAEAEALDLPMPLLDAALAAVAAAVSCHGAEAGVQELAR